MSIKAKLIILILVAVIVFGFWNIFAFALHAIGILLILGAIVWVVFHTPRPKG